MNSSNKIKVLFVCMGNICRSPLAEGVFCRLLADNDLTDKFIVDSAGTSNYHVGDAPDQRAVVAATNAGVKLHHCARQFVKEDFENFDYIMVMDHLNYESVLNLTNNHCYHEKVFLYRTFDNESVDFQNVPDPYYGGSSDFSEVLDIVTKAGLGFLDFLREQHRL